MIKESRLKAMLDDHQKYHSNLQIDRFIIYKSGVTPYGMYKQALRELYSRYESMKREWIDVKLKKVDINELKSASTVDPYEADRNELNLIKAKMDLDTKLRAWKDRIREFARFYEIADTLKAEFFEDMTEKGREWHDKNYWFENLRKKAMLDLITYGKISANIMETIISLEGDMMDKLLNSLNTTTEDLINELSTMNKVTKISVSLNGNYEEEARRLLEC